LKGGFRGAAVAVLDDDSLSATEKIGKLRRLLRAHEDLAGDFAGEDLDVEDLDDDGLEDDLDDIPGRANEAPESRVPRGLNPDQTLRWLLE
jgi:hypothetical protein